MNNIMNLKNHNCSAILEAQEKENDDNDTTTNDFITENLSSQSKPMYEWAPNPNFNPSSAQNLHFVIFQRVIDHPTTNKNQL